MVVIDPALIAQARVVLDALLAAGFEAWQGRGKNEHYVSIRRVTRNDVGAVKAIVKKASDPLWGDVRFFQSFMTIRLMEGRAIELHDEYMLRHAEWGMLYVEKEGGLELVKHPASLVIPLCADEYDDDTAA